MPNNPPNTRLDLQEVTTRNDTARQIIAGFATTLPTLADYWHTIDTALTDTATLATALARTRLDYADLLAAARATLGAHHDGEDDPLSYLRDELHAKHTAGRTMKARQMRRQARKMSRHGVQPMVLITSEDQLPDMIGVLIGRWLWRYRSELAPLYTATLTALAGWLLHATHPGWWPGILATAMVAVFALLRLGHRIGLARLIERAYAATAATADRRLARGRDRRRTHQLPPSATPARRRSPAVHPVVDPPPQTRTRPCRTHTRGLATDRRVHRPQRLPHHVRRGRRLGLDRPRRPPPRPHRRRRTHETARHRIRTRHPPRSRTDRSRPTTARTTSSCASCTPTRTPARCPGAPPTSARSPSRSRWASSRTPPPQPSSYSAATHSSEESSAPANPASSTSSSPHSPHAKTS